MKMLRVRNVHEALPEALRMLQHSHVERDSRNGPVWMAPLPGVATTYTHPCERVLFWNERDANPFFHLMEGIWMLVGRRDVAWIQQFNSNFGQFSDDGEVFHGAYGYRWRKHFHVDQLQSVADALRANPECRRQVIAMWDPGADLGHNGVDLPCNTHLYFQRDEQGRLELLVSCRSNDIVWGCYGANAVHFSMLLEFMAAWIGCPVGKLTQVSFNWHGYLKTVEPLLPLIDHTRDPLGNDGYYNPYAGGTIAPYPLCVPDDALEWMVSAHDFLHYGAAGRYNTPFFNEVAVPMLQAWQHFKRKDLGVKRFEHANRILLECCKATDWRKAALEWLARRRLSWEQKHATPTSTTLQES